MWKSLKKRLSRREITPVAANVALETPKEAEKEVEEAPKAKFPPLPDLHEKLTKELAKEEIQLGNITCYFHGYIDDDMCDENTFNMKIYIQTKSVSLEGKDVILEKKSFSQIADILPDEEVTLFMRDLVLFIEKNLECIDYHLRVCCGGNYLAKHEGRKHNFYEQNLFDYLATEKGLELGTDPVWYVAAAKYIDRSKAWFSEAPDTLSTLKDEYELTFKDKTGTEFKNNVTVKDIVLIDDTENNLRAVFDGQGRPSYVVITRRRIGTEPVSNQNDLSDMEVAKMWKLAVEVSRLNTTENDVDHFLDIRINAGCFKNIKSIHYKVFMDETLFNKIWKDNEVYQKLSAAAAKQS